MDLAAAAERAVALNHPPLKVVRGGGVSAKDPATPANPNGVGVAFLAAPGVYG